jgi:hypothetical protein
MLAPIREPESEIGRRDFGMFNAKKPLALEDAATLLNTRRLPAPLHSSEVAGVLGFQEHDIPVLVIARLLIPLVSLHPMPRSILPWWMY